MKNSKTNPPQPVSSVSKDTVLIPAHRKKTLSKEQTIFNKLSLQIAGLRKALKNDERRYNTLADCFLEQVKPMEAAYASNLTIVVKRLYEMYQQEKLSKKVKKDLGALIVVTLSETFQYCAPAEDIKTIYNKFAEISYEEEEAGQLAEMKESFEDMFQDMYGATIDLSALRTDMSEEELNQTLGKVQESLENQLHEGKSQEASKKKSKKELEQELKDQQDEERKKKTARAIYTSLAKLLHPDLEIDTTLKPEKEELMKELTNAYQKNDLHKLLQLEIQIIYQHGENLDQLTDERLGVINATLQDQVAQIEHEKELLSVHPKYAEIFEFMSYPLKQSIGLIRQQGHALREMKADALHDLAGLTGKNRLSYLAEMLERSETETEDEFGRNDLEDFLNAFEQFSTAPSGQRRATGKKR